MKKRKQFQKDGSDRNREEKNTTGYFERFYVHPQPKQKKGSGMLKERKRKFEIGGLIECINSGSRKLTSCIHN